MYSLLRLDPREVRDFIFAAVALSLTFLFAYIRILMYKPLLVIAVIVGVILGFLLHELAHRFTARTLGYIAFFRAWRLGLLLSVLSGIAAAILPFVPIFAAPGAVYVIPRSPFQLMYARRDEFLIAAAGPCTNIGIAVIGLVLSWAPLIGHFADIVAKINAWLAFFNLLPLPTLDGLKVMRTNPALWTLLFLIALSLVFLTRVL